MKPYPQDKYEEYKRRFPRKSAPMSQSQEVRYVTKQMFENKSPYNPTLIKKIDSKSNVYCEYVPTDGNRPTNKTVLPNVKPSSYDPRGSLPYYVVPVLYVPQKVLSDEEITPEISYQQKRTCDFFAKLMRQRKLNNLANQWEATYDDVQMYDKRYADEQRDQYYEYEDNSESLAPKADPPPHFDCLYNTDYTISTTTVEDLSERTSYDDVKPSYDVYQTKPGYYKTQQTYDDESYKYPKPYKSNKSLNNSEYNYSQSKYHASTKPAKMYPEKSEHNPYDELLKYSQVPKHKSKRTVYSYVQNYSAPKYNSYAENRKQRVSYETVPAYQVKNPSYASQPKTPIKTRKSYLEATNYELNPNPVDEYEYGVDATCMSYMPSEEYGGNQYGYTDQPRQFTYLGKETKTVATHANFVRCKPQKVDATSEMYEARTNYVDPETAKLTQPSQNTSTFKCATRANCQLEPNVEHNDDLYSHAAYFKQQKESAYQSFVNTSKPRQQTVRGESSPNARPLKPRKPFGINSEQINSHNQETTAEFANRACNPQTENLENVASMPQKIYPRSSYDQFAKNNPEYGYTYDSSVRTARSQSPTRTNEVRARHKLVRRELSPLKTDAKLNTLVENPEEPNALIGEPQICNQCIRTHGICLNQKVYDAANEHDDKYVPIYPNGDSVDIDRIDDDKDDSEVSDTFVECNQEPAADKINETAIVSPIVYSTSVKSVDKPSDESKKVDQQNTSTAKSPEKELNQTYIKKSYNDMETSLEDFDEMFSISEVPALSSLRNRTSSSKSDFKQRAPKESQTTFDDKIPNNVITRKLATESKSTQTINYTTLRSLTASTQTERTVFDFRSPQFIYVEQVQEPIKDAPADAPARVEKPIDGSPASFFVRLGRQSAKQHPVIDMKKSANARPDSPKSSFASSTRTSKIPEPKKKFKKIKNVP